MAELTQRTLTTHAGRILPFTGIGFGAAEIGNMGSVLTEEEASDTIRTAWSLGVRYFDTAPLYGLGLSETRVGDALRGERRSDFLLSSKVGLLLDPDRALPRTVDALDVMADGVGEYDYGYDAIMRSVEESLGRLGLPYIDILYVHDIDAQTHGSPEEAERHLRSLLDSGWRALDELRRGSEVKAIGAGLNEWQMCERLLGLVDPDIFLLAGRYTLLEQAAQDSFLPACSARGVGVVVGGPFNSGILATGAGTRAIYDYGLAPDWVQARVRALETVCRRHGVALPQAALSFPLRHPAVVTVIPGCTTADQVRQNVELAVASVPDALWSELIAEGLIAPDRAHLADHPVQVKGTEGLPATS